MAKIFASQTKLKRNKFKYGVQVPTDYPKALKLDNHYGNTLWQDAVKKEMDQIKDFNTFKATKRKKHLIRTIKVLLTR